MLLWLGVGKILALSLCLGSLWKGGEIFPLIFAGAAAGALTHQLLPAIPLTVALMGGIAATCSAGFGKPVSVLLILLLLTGRPGFPWRPVHRDSCRLCLPSFGETDRTLKKAGDFPGFFNGSTFMRQRVFLPTKVLLATPR